MRVKTVYIEIINRCNFNCQTCYNRSGLNHKTVDISAEQLEQTISIFTELGASRFWLSGGEPTLHPELGEIINIIKSHPELDFGIVTNGSSRNSHLIDALNNSKNLSLQISLDGPDEEQNALTRGVGHFSTTVEFAKTIHNPYRKPLLKMVISKNNLSCVEDFYRLALNLGCIPEFAFIFKSGNGSEQWDDKAVTAKEKLEVLKLIDRLNAENGVKAFLPLCTSKCPLMKSDVELSLCVKFDGSVQPCQALYSSEYTLGNIFDFNEIAFQEKLNAIQNIATTRMNTDFDCNKCLLRNECGRGCMAEADHLTGDPLKSDGDCDFRKLQFIGYSLKKQQKGISV